MATTSSTHQGERNILSTFSDKVSVAQPASTVIRRARRARAADATLKLSLLVLVQHVKQIVVEGEEEKKTLESVYD